MKETYKPKQETSQTSKQENSQLNNIILDKLNKKVVDLQKAIADGEAQGKDVSAYQANLQSTFEKIENMVPTAKHSYDNVENQINSLLTKNNPKPNLKQDLPTENDDRVTQLEKTMKIIEAEIEKNGSSQVAIDQLHIIQSELDKLKNKNNPEKRHIRDI